MVAFETLLGSFPILVDMIIEEEKFFTLVADPFSFPYVMQIVASRCAGKDPEYDWSKFDAIEISIIHAFHFDPDNEASYNVVSDNCTEFTVNELAEDYHSDDCNPKIEKIIRFISKLPIGRTKSQFLARVTVLSEE